MTAFRAAVLDHFRRPRHRGALADATASVEGANPLCGDRIRVELRVDSGRIADAGFTADACALCIAAASVLMERVQGMSLEEAAAVDVGWINEKLGGEPPRGRERCARLPIDTLRRAVVEVRGVMP